METHNCIYNNVILKKYPSKKIRLPHHTMVLNDNCFASYDFLHEDFDYNENIKLIEKLNSHRFQLFEF